MTSPSNQTFVDRMSATSNTSTETPATELTGEERILLESACVDTIGQLEQLLEKAREEQNAGFLGESILFGKQMLLLLVEFTEAHLQASSNEKALDAIDKGYQSAKSGARLSASQSWGTLRRIVGKATATDQEVTEAHSAVGKSIATAVSETMFLGIRLLGSQSSVAKMLAESLNPLLDELNKKW